MAGLWRWSVRLVGLIVLVVIALGLYLTLRLDPNEYRADIEQLAAEQGVPLSLNGDVSWTFWPNLGLSLEQVSVGSPDAAVLIADRMSALVAIAPLLQQQVIIESVSLDGATLNLSRDSQGRANWELSEAQGAQESDGTSRLKTAAETSDRVLATEPNGSSSDESFVSGMSLQIAQITLTDLTLNYRDELSDQDLQIKDVQLVVHDFDLAGQPFRWQQSSQLRLADKPPLNIHSEGMATINTATQQLQLLESQLTLLVNKTALAMTVKGQVDLEKTEVDLQAGLAPLNLQQWLTQWQVELPPMAAADALNHVGGSARIVGSAQALKIDDISMVLDRGQWLGHAAVSDATGISVVLNADQLDLDRYLPMAPPENVNVATNTAQQATTSSPKAPASTQSPAPTKGESERVVPKLPSERLPFEDLRELNMTVALGIGQLTVKGLLFDDAVLRAQAQNGVVQLKRLAANQTEGRLSLDGKLDARRNEAKVTLNADLKALQINPLLQALAGESRLNGAVTGTLVLASSGDSLRSWQKHAQGTLRINTQALMMNTLDVERSACELAAMVNRKPVPTIAWKGHTEFEQLSAELKIEGELLRFNSLTAEVENLRIKAKGGLDLRDGRFDVPMDVAFVGQANAERDCQVRDRWRNRDLPLRCEDRLATVSARSCGPDRDRLDDLLTDEVKVQAQDKLKEKLQEKLGEEGGEALDQLLRGLFKRKD